LRQRFRCIEDLAAWLLLQQLKLQVLVSNVTNWLTAEDSDKGLSFYTEFWCRRHASITKPGLFDKVICEGGPGVGPKQLLPLE
jgi:hypothetical protein